MTITETREQLYAHGLIPIIRGSFSLDEILRMAEALLEGGVHCLEITLNSTHALAGMSTCRQRFGGDLLVGAGTVLTAADVRQAVEAGAVFILTPSLHLPSIQEAARLERLLIPGVFTATEAQTAYAAGCQTVKLFPADTMGPGYLKALRAPLNHIDFIPTGGVNAGSIAAFHQAGAVAFGVGSALVKNVLIDDRELAALKARAVELKTAMVEARGRG